jgi:tetratricopeptide (TPR) repeat protein
MMPRVTTALLLAVWCSGCTATPPAGADDASLNALDVQRSESWLRREIRRFRTYPHLDRAFRLMAGGALRDAKSEMEQYLALDPDDLKARFHYVTLLHRLKAHADVIREADTVLRLRPGFAPAHLYRALAYHARQAGAAALRDFQAVAEAADADSSSRLLALGMVADLGLAQGVAQVALAAADRLLALEPGSTTLLRRGRALEALGRLGEAEAAFAQALAEATSAETRTQAHAARAALAERRRNWAQASRELTALLQTDPVNPEIMRRLGEIAYARGDLRDSARWFAASAAVTGSPRDGERVGNALYAVADYAAGTYEFRRLAAQTSSADDRHRILVALANGYLKLDQLPEAVQAFRAAAQLKPDLPTITALADALQRAGHALEAATVLETVADRDTTGRTHLTGATLYAKLRRWEPALHHLAAAATSAEAPAPLKSEAYKQRGFILHSLGRYAEAREAFEQSVRYNARDVSVFMALGEICMKLNAPEDAVTYFKRALLLTERPGPS